MVYLLYDMHTKNILPSINFMWGKINTPLRAFTAPFLASLPVDGFLPQLPQCASKKFYGHRVDLECRDGVIFDADREYDEYPRIKLFYPSRLHHHSFNPHGLDHQRKYRLFLDHDGVHDSHGGVHD